MDDDARLKAIRDEGERNRCRLGARRRHLRIDCCAAEDGEGRGLGQCLPGAAPGSEIRSPQAWKNAIFGTSAFWGVHHKKSAWESSRFFFDKAGSELRRQLGDPAGTGADVGAYLHGAALDAAVSKVESAHDRCTRAEQAAKDGNLAAMHDACQKVFGDAYPG